MDLHPTPFPGKDQATYVKSSKKVSEATKMSTKGPAPPVLRQKRVFGTARNPNITSKPVPEKPTTKPSSIVVQKAAKPLRKTQSPIDVQAIPKTVSTKNSAEKNRTRPKKKSVSFQDKNLAQGDLLEPQTPVRSPSLVKPRLSSTPYHSAERCSKCRFDRLETSSYWLGHINLAESVQKHFVSAAFFRLALESKAEPFRNLLVELKKYLVRHEYLSNDEEWRNLSVNYGLKEESNGGEDNGKTCANEESSRVQDEEKDLQKENCQECEIVEN